MSVTPRRAIRHSTIGRLSTGAFGAALLLGALGIPATSAVAPRPAAGPDQVPTELLPTIHYEDAQRHEGDRIDFAPGGRVTVGFAPRAGDRFQVGGAAPRALPAGRLTGRELRANPPGPSAAPTPSAASTPSATPTLESSPEPTPETTIAPESTPTATPDMPLDAPVVDPTDVGQAEGASFSETSEPTVDLAAQVSPDGLRKEIFGFLPYWELSDSTVLDYAKLSTIAFFGVGAAANGSLERTKDGGATAGWSAWTSSRMTTILNDAHRNNTRVVLTIQSFAWSSAGATKQRTLLGSATARATLAKQVAAAVRDRGADGVNLDFEPLASGYDDEFVALVRKVRAELDAVHEGYQLTFDTTGYIGNYPIEAATAAGGADAIFVMGYDYRSSGSNKVGSIAPIGGPAYDITDTIRAYTARVPASKIILGVPYYGRAWSTDTDQLNATNVSGTKNGASATVIYSTAVDVLADKGRRYDPVEGVAWTAYRRQNCTDAYGCVNPWRQLYVDDVQALKAKYDLVNRFGLRGAGIWALGYDGSRPELWTAIRDKFISDTTAPLAGVRAFSPTQDAESFTVRWVSTDDFAVASHDVEVSIDGGAWASWLSRTTETSGTYVGARGHAFAFRVRAYDHKGNVAPWADPAVAGGSPVIAVGGFGRVQADTLNARSAAGTGASLLTTLGSGDLVAFLEGPVSANGYAWYRVAAPVPEWPLVGTTRTDLWVAVNGGGTTFVAAAVPPHTTRVTAGATLAATPGAEWYPISPTRLLDTRASNGLTGAFVDGSPRSFQLTGRGSIPVDAVAVTANLTVTGATASGYVAIGPSMTGAPSTSTLNLAKGQTIANGLTLRVGSGGTVGAVYMSVSGARAHLILDVTGYYRAGGSGATWYPLIPTRLLDSRSGNGLSGSFATRRVRTLQIAGRGAVPPDAVAVTGNLTATGATGSGYVAMGPTMTASSSTSSLNLVKGKTVANNLTLRLGAGGTAGLVFVGPSGSRTHLVFDVTGYYRAGNDGAEWYPISPTRLLDTRAANGLSGAFVDGSPRSFQLTGRGTIPVNAVAVTANLTVTGATASGYAAIGPSMTGAPLTSTLNLARGQTIANGLTLRVGSGGTVGAVFMSASGARAHEVLDLVGYFR